MSERTTYKLNVKKPKELLELLLDTFPNKTLMSFEGDFAGKLNPIHLYSDKEQGLLIRNTRTPKQVFWVFRLDHETKDYLKKDFFNRIGLRTNVLHILSAFDNNLLFASYDSFDNDCVLLTQTSTVTDDYVQQLADRQVIREFEKINTVPYKSPNLPKV